MTTLDYKTQKSMKALVFHGPHDIRIEDKPLPQIIEPTDAIVKIRAACLCGSDLHPYRGSTKPKAGYIMGHESVSTVVALGSDVKGFKIGDEVLSIFTTQCGDCFYCNNGVSSKCTKSFVFGTSGFDGFQAEYCRVPLADSTLKHTPEGIADAEVVLLADIFPTAFYGVKNLIEKFSSEYVPEMTVLQLGCGPVGLCSIAIAKAKGIKTIYAVDSVEERLGWAKKLGAIPLNLTSDNIEQTMKDVTDGRGADGVLEIVGSKDALDLSFKAVRCGGVISSIGYQHEDFPFNGLDCYMKNITLQFGRCPCYSLFDEAVEVFKQVADQLKGFVDLELPLVDAPRGYELFDNHKARKIIFRPDIEEPIYHKGF